MATALSPGCPDDSARIDQADPRILISAGVLRSAAASNPAWPAQVRLAEVIPIDSIYLGATFRITGVNRTVVYRITEYVPRVDAYIAEWPD